MNNSTRCEITAPFAVMVTRRPRALSPDLITLNRAMKRAAASGSGALTAAQCYELGATKSDIRRLLKQPDWARAERGIYVDLSTLAQLDLDHHRACAAALASLRAYPDAAVSHLSAARLLGLPLPPQPDPRPAITRRPPAPAHPLRNTTVHVATFDESDLVDVAGVPVVAGPRLIVHCCQILGGDSALAIADAMLRRGMTTLVAAHAFMDQHPRMRGLPLARRVLERADPQAENWLESASRWWFAEAGLPRPDLQVPFTDAFGQVQARVDMLFAGEWTVGEADGEGKYEKKGALFNEKQREDWLRREHRLEVVRWTYAEIRNEARRARLIARVRDAFEHAQRERG